MAPEAHNPDPAEATPDLPDKIAPADLEALNHALAGLFQEFARPEGASHKEAEYRQVCKNFGLDLVHYNGETSNIYRPIQFPS